VSFVAGLDEGHPVVRDLVTLGADCRWHRVGSLAAVPERAYTKLSRVCDPSRLLGGFDAWSCRPFVRGFGRDSSRPHGRTPTPSRRGRSGCALLAASVRVLVVER